MTAAIQLAMAATQMPMPHHKHISTPQRTPSCNKNRFMLGFCFINFNLQCNLMDLICQCSFNLSSALRFSSGLGIKSRTRSTTVGIRLINSCHHLHQEKLFFLKMATDKPLQTFPHSPSAQIHLLHQHNHLHLISLIRLIS